jgi:hypothetical protein
MFSLQRIRDGFARARRGSSRMPEPESVRELCGRLLHDVAQRERDIVLHRLGRLRRADDLWDLRNALFGLISLHHGETVARERLSAFDTGMAALPVRRLPPPRRDAWSVTVS